VTRIPSKPFPSFSDCLRARAGDPHALEKFHGPAWREELDREVARGEEALVLRDDLAIESACGLTPELGGEGGVP
jgi:hypothetical protein